MIAMLTSSADTEKCTTGEQGYPIFTKKIGNFAPDGRYFLYNQIQTHSPKKADLGG